MFFTINNSLILSRTGIKTTIINNARMRILLYRYTTNEKVLDNYLIKKYKLNLKLLCLRLLEDCKISVIDENEYVVSFRTKKCEALASLITYGNNLMQGSNILATAFGRN